MEVGNANPSEINSFHVNQKLLINAVDLNKKRKLRAEQFGLPVAKHKCSDGSLPSKFFYTFDENPEVEDFPTNISKEIAEAGANSDESGQETGKGGHSFQEDPDAAISEDNSNSSDGTAIAGGVDNEHHPIHQLNESHIAENLDKPLIEYGENVGYLCSGYGKDSVERYMDKDIEDFFCPDDVNPNIYVLSSGRWNSNQDAQQGKREPTIDQEFEQYFSMLLL